MQNEITLCQNDNCVHATGENAKMIATAFAIMLLLFGIAAIIRASN